MLFGATVGPADDVGVAIEVLGPRLEHYVKAKQRRPEQQCLQQLNSCPLMSHLTAKSHVRKAYIHDYADGPLAAGRWAVTQCCNPDATWAGLGVTSRQALFHLHIQGLAKVLSTMDTSPCFLANATTASRSATDVKGLATVSTKMTCARCRSATNGTAGSAAFMPY